MTQIVLDTPVHRSAKVMQVEGMFDVPPSGHSRVVVEVPTQLASLATWSEPRYGVRDWNLGLIVGPSGSGKSTVAKHLWPEEYEDSNGEQGWGDRAIIDAFPGGVKDATGLLTSVGFGSPPAWLRPFGVLSVGEQFRASVALALAYAKPTVPVVMDEFTSTVDRQVAQVGSHAVQKAVRKRSLRLVAVTCHFDVIDWLQPDWVYRPDSVDFEWRRLQRHPPVELEVREAGREAWALFRHHHYLSADLHVAARVVCAFHDGQPVALNAFYPFPHPTARNIMVSHRTVVLPDYQGLGIGGRLTEHVGEMLAGLGWRYRATLAHPALIAYRRASPRWREAEGQNTPSRSRKPKRLMAQHMNPRKLATRTFEYMPQQPVARRRSMPPRAAIAAEQGSLV